MLTSTNIVVDKWNVALKLCFLKNARLLICFPLKLSTMKWQWQCSHFPYMGLQAIWCKTCLHVTNIKSSQDEVTHSVHLTDYFLPWENVAEMAHWKMTKKIYSFCLTLEHRPTSKWRKESSCKIYWDVSIITATS